MSLPDLVADVMRRKVLQLQQAILYLYIIGNADSQHEAYICFANVVRLVSVRAHAHRGLRSPGAGGRGVSGQG